MQSRELVLFYDGLCRFCDGTVRFILRHDRAGTMRFAPLQGAFAQDVLARHPELHGVDSLILVECEAGTLPVPVAARSEAVLQIAEYLGGGWRAVRVLRVLPVALRDWAYDRFARVRYLFFGRCAACAAPSADNLLRFLP
jgi:predicted DCC family thiol-disulfide oxidoreductase YuxK